MNRSKLRSIIKKIRKIDEAAQELDEEIEDTQWPAGLMSHAKKVQSKLRVISDRAWKAETDLETAKKMLDLDP